MENKQYIKFKELTFTKPGIYKYTLKELTESGYGWNNDKRVYRLNINVTEDKLKKLNIKAEYPDGLPIFTNYFSVEPITVRLCAKKRTTGPCDRPFACFYFGLFDDKGKEISIARNNGEKIIFPKINFIKEGIYHYTIRELSKSCNGWKTDKTIFPVIIKVKIKKNGLLNADINYPKGEPIFVNKFRW